MLPRIKCIVVDEVDRLVDVLSKHAPTREAEKRKRHARPVAALLERVLTANGEAQVKDGVSFPPPFFCVSSLDVSCVGRLP